MSDGMQLAKTLANTSLAEAYEAGTQNALRQLSSKQAIKTMARAMAKHECKGKPWEELHENVREVYMGLARVAAAALADVRGEG